ncbi:MAG: HupE/UreJ family protein [Methylococcaceae bacterium]|nr:HupE/UreJ family protein [Methylococcaceae bacterium]
MNRLGTGPANWLFLITLTIAALGSARAVAHDEPYSHIEIRLDPGRVHGKVMAHVIDLAHEGGLEMPELLLDRGYAQQQLATLHKVLDSRVWININGVRIQPGWQSLTVLADRKSLAFDWLAPHPEAFAKVEVLGPLFPYDPPHETYLNIYENGSIRHQNLLDKTVRSASYYSGTIQGRIEVVREFAGQGIHHIFIGPDHILFIIGLLLPGGGIARLLAIITAFTIAHSLTLVLATLKIIQFPAAVAEPAIALSIVLLGLETLYAQKRQRRDHRMMLAFAFGLIHGFGFAGVLADLGLPEGALGWSLAAFNAGVEIGQACIILVVAPSLLALRSRKPIAARRMVVAGTASIIIAGAFWFVERVVEA